MPTRDLIDGTVAIGAKNQRTLELVKNWCAHARIEKFGGTGVAEQVTGYPIGHHSLACDHAPAGGMACYDLEDSVLDFYDRNCVGCKVRKPVGLPNITSIIAQRDTRAQAAAAEAAKREAADAQALSARRNVREQLRRELGPISKTIVDQIERLDADRTSAAADELVAAAKLAPHAFAPPLVEHLFSLVEEREYWAADASLRVLDALGADRARIAKGLARTLRRSASPQLAMLLEKYLDVAEPADVAEAIEPLVHVASPRDFPFSDHDRPREPAPLIAAHRAFPTAVETRIEELLEERDEALLSAGTRAVCVLAKSDERTAMRFARTVVSKLARSTWISEAGFENGDVLRDLRVAASLAYLHDPAATEALFKQFLLGATEEGQKRIFSVYREVLGGRFRREGEPISDAQRVALSRLIWAATETTSDEVRQEIQSNFSGGPFELRPLAREAVEQFMGAALLLADRLEELDRAKAAPEDGFLEGLQRINRRSGFYALQNNFIDWAARGACGDVSAIHRFLELLAAIPDSRTELRAAFISQVPDLIDSPETLGLILPTLYSAMVGASVAERGAAATAIGELDRQRRNDAPPLLMEAFIALLFDPYLYVVAAAVRALQRFTPPEGCKPAIRRILLSHIHAYAKNVANRPFLVDCIEVVVNRHLTDEELAGAAGGDIVAILATVEPDHLHQELPSLARRLGAVPGVVGLLLNAIRGRTYYSDRLVQALQDLPIATLQANLEALEAFVAELELEGDEWKLGHQLVELFTHMGAWDAAVRTLEANLARMPDTTRNRWRRRFVEMVLAAVNFEKALAEGRTSEIAPLVADWRSKAVALEELRRER